MINEVDADGNSTIDFLEFLNLMAKKMKDTVLMESSGSEMETELDESDEDGRIEPIPGDRGESEQEIHSSETTSNEPDQLFNFWTGPTTRARTKAHQKAIQHLKPTDDEVEEMICEADGDGDGQINYEEFVKIIVAKQLL
ncbi:hypothetical protein HID58_061580 [Brassica napus]|uniref:EF-hand domain-containing protein n=1 Tax=Brassica napus TaxID=3708 RepID=A0ABQ7ZYZ6_BRANA|nr:hypothetical protein HID58_061580 [Brassica napus]